MTTVQPTSNGVPSDPPTAPATVPAGDVHYHQLFPCGTGALIVRLACRAERWVAVHRKFLIAAVPAVIAFVQAQGISVPAVVLTVVAALVGVTPNRKAAK